jgi:hypothetical protein
MDLFVLIDDFLIPEIRPNILYSPKSDAIAWRKLNDGYIYLEIYRRSNGLYSFRYNAWVAWRDADSNVQSHNWHRIDPKDNLLTDQFEEATALAEHNAKQFGFLFSGIWEQNSS